MLHCFQSADHRFDTRAHLFILLQQIRAFRRQYILALFQGAVLILQLVANANERVDALFETLEFVFKSRMDVLSHRLNIVGFA